MTQSELLTAVNDLSLVFSDEHDSLRQGNMKQMTGIADRKSNAIIAFETALMSASKRGLTETERTAVSTVIEAAQKNIPYLKSVRNGVSNIVTRLNGVSARGHVGAYAESGQQLAFSSGVQNYRKFV